MDFVVTWVDDTDPEWLLKKREYSPSDVEINKSDRYRDYGTFKYWFRSIEKNAPWVRKVFLVTEGHYPEWLNKTNKKLILVSHDEFMDSKYLPTFNSNSIELNVHRIRGLSEKFVLFNDDVFLINKTTKEDFFKNGLPRDFGIYSPTVPVDDFSSIIFNNIKVINKNFRNGKSTSKKLWKFFNIHYGAQNLRTLATLPWKKVLGYWNPHLTAPFLKSTFNKVWDKEFELLNRTSMNKFRTSEDVNQWLMRYWQIESDEFVPQSGKLGYFLTLNEIDKVTHILNHSKKKVLCINDDSSVINYEAKITSLKDLMKKKFPNKSSFEM
ncbi:capsule biosynthesis protein CapG [Pediococcus damnosus]|nr:capsule biosynthesis protein CapG [Pediococcus damnosus]